MIYNLSWTLSWMFANLFCKINYNNTDWLENHFRWEYIKRWRDRSFCCSRPFVCQVWFCRGLPEFLTFSYWAWLLNWLIDSNGAVPVAQYNKSTFVGGFYSSVRLDVHVWSKAELHHGCLLIYYVALQRQLQRTFWCFPFLRRPSCSTFI